VDSESKRRAKGKEGYIENIEKVQKRATKLIISLKKLQYLERLRQLKLPTLK